MLDEKRWEIDAKAWNDRHRLLPIRFKPGTLLLIPVNL
jgi:hypothetical protein